MIPSRKPHFVFMIILACFGACWMPTDAGQIRLGATNLEFSIPDKIGPYDTVPIDCVISGSGEVIVQAVATEHSAHSRFFDTAVPHKVGFQVDYLKEEGDEATVRVTNVGNTVWKSVGHGNASVSPLGAFSADVGPGESVTKTVAVSRLRPENGRDVDRRFVLTINRDDSRRLPDGVIRLEMVIADCKPGRIESRRETLDTVPRYESFDEFGHAYKRIGLDGKNPVRTRLNVLTPAWADRLVIRLIDNGAMRSVTLPLDLSEESLILGGKQNMRWTIDGKPVFIVANVRTEEIPGLRERLGGDNVILVTRRILSPDSEWLKAIREHNFKIIPISLAYIRLQNIGTDMGYELMQGAPKEFNIHRVDALDPNFHLAMADVVDKMFEYAGDLLYRTADGKIPMCLSEEQSYGFPFGAAHPTRWGGSSPANVAAFREWLREKYGTIDKLNKAWKWEYQSFDEIDSSPLAFLATIDYPDPWKEWGPAIEDFDIFRSKIHGEFWSRTIKEIKRRHPDVICGLNVYGDIASETEPIYHGTYDWGIRDYRGREVNWVARRVACLPDDLMDFDFFVNWNTGSPEATKRAIDFWHGRGKEVVMYARGYGKVVFGGEDQIRTHAPLHLNRKGMIINQLTSFYNSLKTAYEMGGVPGVLNDPGIGSKINEIQRREIELFNQAITRSIETKN